MAVIILVGKKTIGIITLSNFLSRENGTTHSTEFPVKGKWDYSLYRISCQGKMGLLTLPNFLSRKNGTAHSTEFPVKVKWDYSLYRISCQGKMTLLTMGVPNWELEMIGNWGDL